MDICRTDVPPEVMVGGVRVACHLYPTGASDQVRPTVRPAEVAT
jgi:hypothetical protein